MSNVVPLPLVGPNGRMAIMAELLRQVAMLDGPKPHLEVFTAVLEAFGVAEEKIGTDIWNASAMAIYEGFIVCNGYDRKTGTIRFLVSMTFAPSLSLRRYAKGEYITDGPNEDFDLGGTA